MGQHPLLVNTDSIVGAAPGQLSLLSAVEINAFADPESAVRFDPAFFAVGTHHTIKWSGQLPISGPQRCTIQGPGVDVLTLNIDVSGPPVPSQGGTLSISGMTVTGYGLLNSGGTLNITDCVFSGIQGTLGSGATAAVYNESGYNQAEGILNITQTVFTDNAPTLAGAVFNTATAVILDCTFSRNSAWARGGAISNSGSLRISNSTITGNSAPFGAAIDQASSASSTLVISDCTISGNLSGSGGAIDGAATLNNTIVAGNTLSDGTTPADISGTVTGSNNLIGTGGSSGLVNGVNGNIVGVADPMLGPLGNYGGPTQTIPLLPGSPALDAGSNALALDGSGNPLTTDQRGLPRIYNGTMDIGAFEAQPPALAGDVNRDGKVDFSDLLILAQHYGSTTQPLWEGGDLTGDGAVAFPDLLVLAQNYGHSATAAAASPLDLIRHSAGKTTLVRRRAAPASYT